MCIHQWALVLLLSVSLCHATSEKNVEVVGFGECSDCAQSNIKASQAFAGLGVTVDCKIANGAFKTRGVGKLDKEGKFSISLDKELVKDGQFSEECYAQLHSASNIACPALNGLESAKLILKEKINGKHKFGLVGKLKFSPVTCTSAFLWPHYKYPTLPPMWPYHHPWSKHLPPPVPIYKKPYLPPVPVYTKPLPPPVPFYKAAPVYKPKPTYKPAPTPKVYKPHPFPKITLPPSIPVYTKPFPPMFKKPLPPLPPFLKFPPCTKPPLPKLPPFPKLPPKYHFSHPLKPFVPPHP